uniref:DNA-directed RNA polymerase subunit n=1 Tax=Nucleocytoviricota sp. TaxID=2809609 RepID=A0A9E8G4K0_9VIRU|nr:hypothetical protein [Nucleocytoviricota sp.]UZT29288.1 hypothetical protein [Nucleocytoviricota sp.]
MNKNKINKHNKIIGIQFSILSPDEIRNGSVAEITNRDTYINNKPVIGGLFDPRMGVLEPGYICPTDGLDYINTPGYFGHIELSRPVFYIQYIQTIIKILRCVCIKCSKLLINKEKHKHCLNMKSDERWNYVFSQASKIKRCGEDCENGCGCKQPFKIKKQGLATLIADWDPKLFKDIKDFDEEKLSMKLIPELVLKIFKRISDEDVNFMGFNSLWSRPDWMICQVLAVPPPSVRPSVKHDSQQRSEDDLSHIIVNIIKANEKLQEKIQQNATEKLVEDWQTLLQYFIAILVDNKIPGVNPLSQRSGRPLKSIKERLTGKTGRVRGNLMGKRVDFSARSVITPDPNLSIRELGIPLKIAKNLTKPIVVNDKNKKFLYKLVLNGPDEYPGAKIYEKKNGDSISLRYVDRSSIVLENGDIVHRHMMDGDAVLFNRQPTLHRMSMMCHICRIMKQGDTFRMNVGDTKPYNADFDGDEMNLHMPQDDESEIELRKLAAIPYQIISPANNKSIIGIFQDSLLGAYLFTRNKINFNKRTAMNLLMHFNEIDLTKINFNNKETISNFEILTQIMPLFSLKYKTKRFGDNDDFATSNNVLEIKDGKYIRGNMEKGVLGDGSKGLLQRIYNDFSPMNSANFIDNLQNIVTEFMKYNGYSVGISDLIANTETNDEIKKIIYQKQIEVRSLIDQTHLGIFENKTGKTNQDEFEQQVNNILNKASAEAGKIGRKNLDIDNRFVIMVNAGSKGSDLNISQMISCLGQQNVDGKRIPYGFENRTLPHFTKYDDSPSARGFVENSFISGLTPQELFFHAMGGRVGLIDTAVKTSQTGYIQRRLIKSLEDLMVNYDMTVRNNKNKIIQYVYGDDNFDPVHVESQMLPFLGQNIEDIYNHFQILNLNKDDLIKIIFDKQTLTKQKKEQLQLNKKTKYYIEYIIDKRKDIIEKIFKNTDGKNVNMPVSFSYLINNIKGKQPYNVLVDITLMETYEIIESTFEKLNAINYARPNELFKVLYFYYLSPKDLIINKRFTKVSIELLMVSILKSYKESIVAPGEMVGMIAAQSIGEPTTQMSETKDAVKKIIIVSKNGNICHKTIKIGELCDEFIEKYPQYTFPTGHLNSVETLLDKLDKQYYIVGVDKYEKTSWNRISHFSRHPINGDLVTIKTKSGRSVTTTLSHSHLTRQNHKVEPIKGSELSVGMRIPICKHIENSFIVNTVEIANNKYNLDKQLGWFIGAYLAEGNCNGNEICITNISEYYINNTLEISKLFNSNGYVDRKPGQYGPGAMTKFKNKELAKFLLENCGKNSFEKKVPEFIFTAPNECKAGLLQGYMDGDGNINCDKNHHEIRACSRSEQLIKDLSLLFNYFDIFTTFNQNERQNKPLYHLSISNSYATLYKDNIGSILKIDKLNQLCEYENRLNAHSLSNDIDKIEGLGEIIAYCGKELKLPGQSRNYGRWKNKLSIGRRTLQKYIKIFKQEIGEQRILINEIKLLEQAAESNIIWDEIVDINIYTPDQNEYVYDFTVPGNQTFMEESGIIVHNTLNTFHFAGISSKSNVTRGVPRIEEILSLSENPKNPSCTVYLNKEEQYNQEKAKEYMNKLEHTKLKDIVDLIEVYYDPDDMNTLIEEDKSLMQQYNTFEKLLDECGADIEDGKEKSKWILRIALNKESMLEKNLTMEDIHFAIKNSHKDNVSCIYSDYNDDQLIFRIRLNISSNKKKLNIQESLDQSDQIYLLKNFQEDLLENLIIRGIKNINKVILRKITDNIEESEGKFDKKELWVLDTVGTNLLDVLALDYIDKERTYSNDIQEIYRTLGVEAARQSIFNELSEVIEFDGTYINFHHVTMLCDRMCCNDKLVSIFRHGINNDDIGPIAKASFEETPEMFLKAAKHGELDNMKGVSSNILCGQEGYYGTSSFQVMLDLKEVVEISKSQQQSEVQKTITDEEFIDKEFGEIEDPNDVCSLNNLAINIDINNLKDSDMGKTNNYNPGF